MFEKKEFINHKNEKIVKIIPVDTYKDYKDYEPFPGPFSFIPSMVPMVDFVYMLPVEIPIPIPNMYGIPSINPIEILIPIHRNEANTLEEAFNIYQKKSDEIERKLTEEIDSQIKSNKNKLITPDIMNKAAASKLQIVK